LTLYKVSVSPSSLYWSAGFLMDRAGDGKQRNPGSEASQPAQIKRLVVEFEAAEFCRDHGFAAACCI
jgi:hypothetical protein